MRRLAWVLKCVLCLAGFPQIADADSCRFQGQCVASTPLDFPPFHELPLMFTFTPPTSCSFTAVLPGTGVPSTVVIAGILSTPGQPQPEQFTRPHFATRSGTRRATGRVKRLVPAREDVDHVVQPPGLTLSLCPDAVATLQEAAAVAAIEAFREHRTAMVLCLLGVGLTSASRPQRLEPRQGDRRVALPRCPLRKLPTIWPASLMPVLEAQHRDQRG
jgi:hypothetical protein